MSEWFDGAIHNDDSADDVRNAPLAGVHVLTGPFHVEGAAPGDLLIVDILEIDACDQEDEGPLSGMGWGHTGVFATSNGGGFLTERFPGAHKVIWDFTGDVATSRHIPECSCVGIHHPGLMGTAPSAELLASAILGRLTGADFDRVAGEGARTAPPRENGGNQDTSRASPRAPGSSTPSSSRERSCRSATCTSPRATARSPSVAPSRWAGSWTCTST